MCLRSSVNFALGSGACAGSRAVAAVSRKTQTAKSFVMSVSPKPDRSQPNGEPETLPSRRTFSRPVPSLALGALYLRYGFSPHLAGIPLF